MPTSSKHLRLLSAFRRWDADGDGFISEAELQHILKTVGVPEDEFSKIFRAADKNQDGKLDHEEFMAWVFSSNEAAAKVWSAATAVSWPDKPEASMAPGGTRPEKLQVDAPAPCKEDGVAYWSIGGASKSRMRVLEDAGVLKLAAEYTVGVRFRVSKATSAGYDSLLIGHNGIHWLAIDCSERRLCCVNSKTKTDSVLGHSMPCDEWVVVFLQPRGDKTAAFTFDEEGMFEVGKFDLSLVGSKLDKMGWADNEIQVADILIWNRCVPWHEMALVMQQPPPPSPPPPDQRDKHLSAFRGQVLDLKGKGLPDVKVGWGKGSCLTDEDGCFTASFSDAETDVPDDDGASGAGSASSVGSTVVNFACEGFAPMTAVAQCTPGGPEATLQVTLREVSASAVMDAEAGGSVEDKATGSRITVPPNSLCYPDGSPVEGPITVSLSVLDVTDPAVLASMPGDFSAVGEDGSSVFLQSLGAAWVGASDEQGRDLAVKDGSEGVGLDLKSTATADPEKLGADAELWTFNEASGKWELQQQSLLKVNGETAPNSAARATMSAAKARGRKKPMGKKKGKMGRKVEAKFADDSSDDGLIEGCMSPEAFKKAVNKEGEKTLSTNLTKLGYINCDLAYHHPQRAVMLTGTVLSADGQPLEGMQLWSVGRDYNGRCPDVSKQAGKFGQMIAQFDSDVDVEVHVPMRVPGDEKIEARFDDCRVLRGLSKDAQKLVDYATGKYTKTGETATTWSKNKNPNYKPKNAEDRVPNVSIVWCEERRRWQTTVDGQVVFVRETNGDDKGEPFGGSWRPLPSAFPGDPTFASAPTFARPVIVEAHKFGPFKTGPPGEFVDIGELVVKS